MRRKKINRCHSWDEHWGCAISPMKNCSGCPNADWHVEEQPNAKSVFKGHTVTEDLAWNIYNLIGSWKNGEFGEVPLQDVLDKFYNNINK